LLKAIWHRPAQACVIAVLSGLVTVCAVVTPLYQRALDQASAQVELDHAAPTSASLQLTSSGILPTVYTGQGQPVPALTPTALVNLMPPSVRPSFRAPVAALSVTLTMPGDVAQPSNGQMTWREGACGHLEMVSGQCPTGERQIAVSTADAKNFGWAAGSTVTVAPVVPRDALDGPGPPTVLTVSGVYRPPTDAYWTGWALTGTSGTNPDRGVVLHDTWITAQPTFANAASWPTLTSRVDLAVDRQHTRVDDLLRLGPALSAFQQEQRTRPVTSALVRAESGLPAIADQVRDAKDQSRLTIPALTVPLGVLGLVVLWMALGAAVEQRRPEVAVARLRGQGVRGAQAHLLRELLPIVLAGVPLGIAAALALSWPTRHLLLPGDVPFEWRPDVWVAVLAATVAVTTSATLVSAGISREPIIALLRRVPVRRSGWRLGTVDAVVVTVAASILFVFATGRLTGPVALAAPAVLALAVGLVLARLLTPVATSGGRFLLARGATGAGIAFLQLARRPGSRATIALLTVSAAILVFAADVVIVGDRNRELTAAQQVGAPMVATVTGGSVRAAREALATVDPRGRKTTTVVVQHPLTDRDQTNLFVDRAAFLRIATFPDDHAARTALGRLGGQTVPPIKVVGTTLSVDVATQSFYEKSHREVDLAVQLLGHDGVPVDVPLGQLSPGTSGPTTRQVPIDCAEGCVLTGWKLQTDPGNSGKGRVILGSARTGDGRTISLGKAADWAISDHEGARIQVLGADAQSLTIFASNTGASTQLVAHRWVPAILPAAVSGVLPPDSTGTRFDGLGLDGVERPMVAAARVPWLPAATRNATLSDLELTLRSGMALGDNADLQVWFATEDSRTLAAVTKALAARQMKVTEVARRSSARELLDDSAATWSMQLGVLVGVASLLVAALGLAIAGAASWRSRARDLSVLRLNGLAARDARRISLGEQLPVVLVSVVIGAGAGVLAAHYALPTLPLLPVDPAVDLVDLSAAWGSVLVLTVLTLLVLGVVGALVAGLVARRASLDRAVGTS
jgi:putative ABC transport system permease protein